MKCIVCEEPNLFAMKETVLPEPRQGEALVRVKRIGICGTDLHAYRGNQPYFTYPRVLGHELAGEVAQVWGEESGFHIGDQVAILPYLECGECIACRSGKTNCCTQMKVLGVHTDGGMREFLSVPLDHLIKANDLNFDQLAIVEPLSIGAHAVRRGQISAGENVLVIGAGPIGLGVMKFAKLAGANVLAMDINEERLRFCRQWAGSDHTVNALQDPVGEVERLTSGEFPTTVFDATGNAKSMMNAFAYAAHGGKLVYVGLVKSDITFSDPDFHKKELTLMGSRNATREDFDHVIRSIRAGLVDASSYITHRSSFDGMIGTFENWLKPETGVIKAVVEVNS